MYLAHTADSARLQATDSAAMRRLCVRCGGDSAGSSGKAWARKSGLVVSAVVLGAARTSCRQLAAVCRGLCGVCSAVNKALMCFCALLTNHPSLRADHPSTVSRVLPQPSKARNHPVHLSRPRLDGWLVAWLSAIAALFRQMSTDIDCCDVSLLHGTLARSRGDRSACWQHGPGTTCKCDRQQAVQQQGRCPEASFRPS